MRVFTEYRSDPRGVDTAAPVFSWIPEALRQAACRVRVQRLPDDGGAPVLCFDSGRVDTPVCTGLPYAGTPLLPDTVYLWDVTAFSADGQSESGTGRFATGLLGRPIGRAMQAVPSGTDDSDTAPRFLRRIDVEKPVARATIFVRTNGFYELYADGTRIGEQCLAPAVAPSPDEEERPRFLPYDVHDVTDLLQSGTHTLALWLGDGYGPRFSEWGWRYQGQKQAQLLLRLHYADGTTQEICADEHWLCCPHSPIVHNDLYAGEQYDATAEDGWLLPGFSAAGWQAAVTVDAPGEPLFCPLCPPIVPAGELRPSLVRRTADGSVWDMGQNFSGVVRLTVQGARDTAVTLRHAEDIAPDGSLDTYTNRNAAATDVYILRGEGIEQYQPRFTYHGFRYVEVTGAQPIDLVGIMLYTAVPETGHIVASDPLLARVWENIRWSMRADRMSYPTDCAARDERTPCQMDSATYEETAMLTADLRAYYRHWLRCTRGTMRAPDWSGDAVLICHRLWLYGGDEQIVRESFPILRDYLDHLMTTRAADGTIRQGFGDWAAPNADGSFDGSFADVAEVDTALLSHILRLGAELADAVGAPDGARLRAAADEVSDAYARAFYDEAAGSFGAHLTPNVLALAFSLGSAEMRAAAGRYIVRDLRKNGVTPRVGIYGARYLPQVLFALGEPELGLGVLTATDYPSIGWQIGRGATTLWEQWQEKGGMESHDHAMFAGLGTALYTGLAGIRPTAPGFLRAEIAPQLPRTLDRLSCETDTPCGPIAVDWARRSDGVRLCVHVPPQVTAEFVCPQTGRRSTLSGGEHRFFYAERKA